MPRSRFHAILLAALFLSVGTAFGEDKPADTCVTALVVSSRALRQAVLSVARGFVGRGADGSFFAKLGTWEETLKALPLSNDAVVVAAIEAETARVLAVEPAVARRLVARLLRRLTPAPAAVTGINGAVALLEQSPWRARIFGDARTPVSLPAASDASVRAAALVATDGAWQVDVWHALSLLPALAANESPVEWLERHRDRIPYLWGSVAEAALLGDDAELLPGPAVRVEGVRHADAWKASVENGRLVVSGFVEAKASLAGIERATLQPTGFVERLFGPPSPAVALFERPFPVDRLDFRVGETTRSFAETRRALEVACADFPRCETDELETIFGREFFASAFPAEQAAFLRARGGAPHPTAHSRDDLVTLLSNVLEARLGKPVPLAAIVRAIGSARRSGKPLPVWDEFRRSAGRSERFVPGALSRAEELSWLAAISDRRRNTMGSGFVANPSRFFRELLRLFVPNDSPERDVFDRILVGMLRRNDTEGAQRGKRAPLVRLRQAVATVEAARLGLSIGSLGDVGTTGRIGDRPIEDVTLEWFELLSQMPRSVRTLATHAPTAPSNERLARFLDPKNGSAQWITEFSGGIRLTGYGYARNPDPFFRRLIGLAEEPRRGQLLERYEKVGLLQWDSLGVTRHARGTGDSTISASVRVIQALEIAIEAVAPAGTPAIDACDREAVRKHFETHAVESRFRYGARHGLTFIDDENGGIRYFRELSQRAIHVLQGYREHTPEFFGALVRAFSEDPDDWDRFTQINLRKGDGERAGTMDDAGAALERVRTAASLVVELALGCPPDQALDEADRVEGYDAIDRYETVAKLMAGTEVEERVFGVEMKDLEAFAAPRGALDWLYDWSLGRKVGDPRRNFRADPERFFREFLDRAVPPTTASEKARRECLEKLEDLELARSTAQNAFNAIKDQKVSRNRAPLVKLLKAFALVAKAIRATSARTSATKYAELVQLPHLKALLALGAPPVGAWLE